MSSVFSGIERDVRLASERRMSNAPNSAALEGARDRDEIASRRLSLRVRIAHLEVRVAHLRVRIAHPLLREHELRPLAAA
jgi:uncharacterized protein YceH (UPF0502 family)